MARDEDEALARFGGQAVLIPESGLVVTPARLSLSGPTALEGPELPLKHEAALVSILPQAQPVGGCVPAFVVWAVRRSDE